MILECIAEGNSISNIGFNKFRLLTGKLDNSIDYSQAAVGKVVKNYDRKSSFKQLYRCMRPNISGSTSDQDFSFHQISF